MEEPNREEATSAEFPRELEVDEPVRQLEGIPEELASAENPQDLERDEPARQLDEIREILLGCKAPENETHFSEIEADVKERVEDAQREMANEMLALEGRLREELKAPSPELLPTSDDGVAANAGDFGESIAALDERLGELLELATTSHEELRGESKKQTEALRVHIRDTKDTLESVRSLIRHLAITILSMFACDTEGDPLRGKPSVPDDAACGEGGGGSEGPPPEEAPPGGRSTDTGGEEGSVSMNPHIPSSTVPGDGS